MPPSTGTLTLNTRHIPITQADCSLFVGRLDIDFELPDGDGACRNIPVGDIVEFPELSGRTVTIDDCPNATFENDIFRPTFALHDDVYTVTSLHVTSLEFLPDRNSLAFAVNLTASSGEGNTVMAVSLQGTATCNEFIGLELLVRQETIPVRFASHYLPLLGLPKIPEDTDRAQVISIFGQPDDEGGGPHAKHGKIPPWVRYTLPTCLLRIQFDSDSVTHVTLMPNPSGSPTG